MAPAHVLTAQLGCDVEGTAQSTATGEAAARGQSCCPTVAAKHPIAARHAPDAADRLVALQKREWSRSGRLEHAGAS